MRDSSGFNRRQSTRVNITTDLSLVLVDAKAAGILDGKERIHLRHGKISDLSVSGMQLTVYDLESGWHFHLLSGSLAVAVRFQLPGDNGSIGLLAGAVRIVEDRSAPQNCSLGLKFIDIKPEDKERIAAFIASSKL